MNKTKVNFLPDDYLQKKAQRRIHVICLVLLLVVALGVASAIAVTEQRRRNLDNSTAVINDHVEQAEQSLKQLDAVQARRKDVLTKAKASAALIEPLPQSLILALMTNRLPKGVVLTNYKMTSKEIAPSRPVNNGSKNRNKTAKRTSNTGKQADSNPALPPKLQTNIELKGTALSDMEVAQFVQNLNDSQLITEVNLPYSKSNKKNEIMREFKITAQLRPDAHVVIADLADARNSGQDALGKRSSFLNLLFGSKN